MLLSHKKQTTVSYERIIGLSNRVEPLKTKQLPVNEKKRFLEDIVDRLTFKTKDK